MKGLNLSIPRILAVSAASGFVVFFIWIVVTANRGEGAWWSFIDRIPYGDKVGHLGLVGMLSFLCNLAFPSRKPAGFRYHVSPITLVLLVLLSLEELSQGFNAFRHLDLYDWLADLVGLAGGQILATWISKRRIKSPATKAP